MSSKSDEVIIEGCALIVDNVLKANNAQYLASQLLMYLQGQKGQGLLGNLTPAQGYKIAVEGLKLRYKWSDIGGGKVIFEKKLSPAQAVNVQLFTPKSSQVPVPPGLETLVKSAIDSKFATKPNGTFNCTKRIPPMLKGKCSENSLPDVMQKIIEALKPFYAYSENSKRQTFKRKKDSPAEAVIRKFEGLSITKDTSLDVRKPTSKVASFPSQVDKIPFKSQSILVTSNKGKEGVDIHEKKHSIAQRTMAEIVGFGQLETSGTKDVLVTAYDLKQYFQSKTVSIQRSYSLVSDWKHSSYFNDSTLLGTINDDLDQRTSDEKSLFLNTNEPFCLVAVGTQGNGKSHTVSCILESCLFPFPGLDVINLKTPMNAVVFHYDINVNYICEAVGVKFPNPALRVNGNPAPCLAADKLTVLVSPQNYYNRNHFYSSFGITVKPLMFSWETLTADNIKKIMGIDENGNQLYMHSLLEILKSYQRRGCALPAFDQFVREVKETCTVQGQIGPLEQRIRLLESLIKESKVNQELQSLSGDLMSCCNRPGTLVIVDLSDPLLARLEANSIFQVLAEQYCAVPPLENQQKIAKLLLIDEAHKFMDGVSTDGLSNAIVDIARLMRHQGIRLVVSTQSPKALAPELLELSSVAVMHQFTSREWFDHLAKKLPLNSGAFERIMSLNRGEALVFAKRHAVKSRFSAPPPSLGNTLAEAGSDSGSDDEDDNDEDEDQESNGYGTTTSTGVDKSSAGSTCTPLNLDLSLGTNIFPVVIRQRVTKDLGASNCNA